jgi:hypothetical protein
VCERNNLNSLDDAVHPFCEVPVWDVNSLNIFAMGKHMTNHRGDHDLSLFVSPAGKKPTQVMLSSLLLGM